MCQSCKHLIDNCLFRDNVRKYIKKERAKIRSRKNSKRKSNKKYRVYNTEDNRLSKKSFIESTDFDIEKSINKKLAALSKKNISKILKND